MVNIERMRVGWSGFVGGPGVSTFYSTDAEALYQPLRTWFNTVLQHLPGDVTCTFEAFGDIIDPLSGDLVGSWVTEAGADIDGGDTGGYAAPTGMLARWLTGTILHGHRLVGKTFLVPAANSCFESDGSVKATVRAAIDAATVTMLAAAPGLLVVWNRPKPGQAGGFSAVTSGAISAKAAVLRSRRD